MNIIDQALEFTKRGIAVFPVRFRDKRPAVPKWEIYKTYLPTSQDLRGWFSSNLHNYAVVLGWQRLAVLDFDDMEVYTDWLDFDKQFGMLQNAYRVKTSRGMHVYFHLLEDRHNMKLPGIDFKSAGYVVGPGSTHPSGHIYTSESEFYFPIIDKLEQVVTCEMLKDASEYDLKPVRPIYQPTAKNAENAAFFDIWEQAESATENTKTPLEKVLGKWGIASFFPGVTAGDDFTPVCCPFHEDSTASAWINTRLNLFGCSSCNMRPMSPVGLYAALHQVDIKQAIKEMI